jgi:hypothetical protein
LVNEIAEEVEIPFQQVVQAFIGQQGDDQKELT